MLYVFPAHLFRPTSTKAGIVENVISGGRSLSGEEDAIATDGGGLWQITHSGINLRKPVHLRLWQAWASHLAGGARACLVPLLSLTSGPRPIGGNTLLRPSGIHADDDIFPTDVRFGLPLITAVTASSATLRATTLTIRVEKGARIQGGEICSINGRGFRIQRVTSRSGMTATCIVSPPTREAIEPGTAVIFDWPLVRCRAALGQDLNPEIQFGRTASIAVAFIEDFSDVAA